MDANDVMRFVGIPAFVALGGVAVSAMACRTMRGRVDSDSARFMDDLARGTFAFVFFLLAFTVSEGRESMSRARAVVVEESSVLRQMRRELPEGGRVVLDAYAQSVIEDEWPTLGLLPPERAPESDAAFRELIDVCTDHPERSVDANIARLEHLRAQRLQIAHAGSPPTFWAVIGVLMVAACTMYGAVVTTTARRRALGAYLAGFGLVIALVVELERPFAGLIRVRSDALADVVKASDPR